MPHYRVNYASNSTVKQNNILLVDSGGQYLDGTTDITRTIAIGKQSEEVKIAFTRVLKGLIAISKLKFPTGTCGRDIDAFARAPLWEGGQDFAHGTGHGVGHYLSVHEGPHRISKFSNVNTLVSSLFPPCIEAICASNCCITCLRESIVVDCILPVTFRFPSTYNS